jgi:hypothetical protein
MELSNTAAAATSDAEAPEFELQVIEIEGGAQDRRKLRPLVWAEVL